MRKVLEKNEVKTKQQNNLVLTVHCTVQDNIYVSKEFQSISIHPKKNNQIRLLILIYCKSRKYYTKRLFDFQVYYGR